MGRNDRLIIMDVDWRELERAARSMRDAPHIIQEELGRAVMELALLIEGHAKKRCPVDTGLLRSSILPVVESWAEAYVGTNVKYAIFVEYGTRKTKAQPYLEPAFLEGKGRAKAIFDRAIDRAMRRIGRIG